MNIPPQHFLGKQRRPVVCLDSVHFSGFEDDNFHLFMIMSWHFSFEGSSLFFIYMIKIIWN